MNLHKSSYICFNSKFFALTFQKLKRNSQVKKATDEPLWERFNNKNGHKIKIQYKNNQKINRKNIRLIFCAFMRII